MRIRKIKKKKKQEYTARSGIISYSKLKKLKGFITIR